MFSVPSASAATYTFDVAAEEVLLARVDTSARLIGLDPTSPLPGQVGTVRFEIEDALIPPLGVVRRDGLKAFEFSFLGQSFGLDDLSTRRDQSGSFSGVGFSAFFEPASNEPFGFDGLSFAITEQSNCLFPPIPDLGFSFGRTTEIDDLRALGIVATEVKQGKPGFGIVVEVLSVPLSATLPLMLAAFGGISGLLVSRSRV